MKVLVVGANGMLGYSIFSILSNSNKVDVYGSVRTKPQNYLLNAERLILNMDLVNFEAFSKKVKTLNPQVIINCAGLIKQNEMSKSYVDSVLMNSLIPHKLAGLCDEIGAKLIHFSTDCIFDGQKGMYEESDIPDSLDLYGRSKYMGEVNYSNHLTFRTSIIGHELNSCVSLIDWFLSQNGSVKGFSKAIFSGLPTCYIGNLLVNRFEEIILLKGLYHLSAEPINKYELIKLVANVYSKNVDIIESTDLVIDRSLNSSRLRAELSLIPPTWPELINSMYADYVVKYLNN